MESDDSAFCQRAVEELVDAIQSGRDSVWSQSDWVTEEAMLSHFGLSS